MHVLYQTEIQPLGFQLLAGLGYEISDNLTWDTHYRYLDSSGNLEFDGYVQIQETLELQLQLQYGGFKVLGLTHL